jgi:hypothetical protein
MKSNRIALVAALILGAAGPALAGGSTGGLTAGGRTLAGPAPLTIGAGLTATVYTHASSNTDACATAVNTSKGSSVQIVLVGPASSTATVDVPAGGTGSLCKDQLLRMDLTCLGTSSCTAQWRVDRN